jgi:hypothetical protein
MVRIAKRRLAELDGALSGRDKAILRSLDICRYLSTGQIRRLHYAESKNAATGLRSTNFGTAKLRSYGLIEVLDRRVGGARAGSKSYVWTITEAGINLLNFCNKDCEPEKRNFTPSPNFMKHTLEVSEVYVQLMEVCRKHGMELVKTEMEPECWRPHKGEDGKPATMKPDLFAITGKGKYEDCWFFEVDMNTESPSVVLEKCRRYAHYCKCGHEQKKHTVFPVVVWIAYSINRKIKLRQYIDECRDLWPKHIFLVIMPDEFEMLIHDGAETLLKKRGDDDESAA